MLINTIYLYLFQFVIKNIQNLKMDILDIHDSTIKNLYLNFKSIF